jgi:hypothetical protein
MPFDCFKHLLSAGRGVTGSCYEFHDIPKNQEIEICVQYNEGGPRRCLTDYFRWFEPINYIHAVSD